MCFLADEIRSSFVEGKSDCNRRFKCLRTVQLLAQICSAFWLAYMFTVIYITFVFLLKLLTFFWQASPIELI